MSEPGERWFKAILCFLLLTAAFFMKRPDRLETAEVEAADPGFETMVTGDDRTDLELGCIDIRTGQRIVDAALTVTGPGGRLSGSTDDEGRLHLELRERGDFPFGLDLRARGYAPIDWRVRGDRFDWEGLNLIRMERLSDRPRVCLAAREAGDPDRVISWICRAPRGDGLVEAPRRGRICGGGTEVIGPLFPDGSLELRAEPGGETFVLDLHGLRAADRPLLVARPR